MKTVGGLLAFGLVAIVNGQYYQNGSGAFVSYETITTSVHTTYCPGPTTITQGGKTYTVTEATTLTITVHTVYGPTTTPKGGDEYETPIVYKPTDRPAPVTKTVVSEKEYWTTTIVPEYVTYCPYATTFTHGEETYVVTEPKTVTVTKCGGKDGNGKGCTISYTVPPKETKSPVTKFITKTYITSDIPTTIVTYSIATITVTPYEPVTPPTYPPKTVVVTISTATGDKPPVVTHSIYQPPPPILCLGCYTIPVYLPPSPSGKPPVEYTTPIPVYTAVVPPPVYTTTPPTSTGPVPCNPAYGFPPVYGPPGCIPPWIVTGGPPVSTGPAVPCYPTTELPPVYGPPGCIPPWLITLPPPAQTYVVPPPPASTYVIPPPPTCSWAGYPPVYGPEGCIPPKEKPTTPVTRTTQTLVYAPPIYTQSPGACDPPTGNPPKYNGPAGCTPPAVYPPVYTQPPASPPVYTQPPASPPVYTQPPASPPVYTQPPASPPPVYTVPVIYKPTSTNPALYTGAAERINTGHGAMLFAGLVVLFI